MIVEPIAHETAALTPERTPKLAEVSFKGMPSVSETVRAGGTNSRSHVPWFAMTRARLVSTTLLFGTFLVCAAGCKPKAGKACKVEHVEVCEGANAALSCNQGTWQTILCKGAQGCTTVGPRQGQCDQSTSEVGEACNMDRDHACTPDKLSMLQCKDHKWELVGACRGQKHCELAPEKKQVNCDMSLAEAGDPCDLDATPGSENYACTTDAKGMLKCVGGKFVIVSKCGGPEKCRIDANKVKCDDSLAAVGDPCDHSEKSFACSHDRTEILACENRVFVSHEKCDKKKKCDVSEKTVSCKG
jgi:hypothetical protein